MTKSSSIFLFALRSRVTYSPNFTAGLPQEQRERLIARYGPRSEAARAGRQELFTQPSLSTYSFVFNTRRGPFTDPRLRRAVNFAMDRRALARNTGGSEAGRPTDQIIPPGIPGFEATGWNGFLLPARTPREVVAKLHEEIVRTLSLPDVQERYARAGIEPVGGGSQAFGALIVSELEKWGKVAREAGLRAEE